jgi:hypothetical protein
MVLIIDPTTNRLAGSGSGSNELRLSIEWLNPFSSIDMMAQ